MRLAWPFVVYTVLFGGGACVFPFFVLFYQSLGFSGAQIGLLTGITPLVTLVSSPLWTNLADATRRHRLVSTGLVAAAAVIVFFIPSARTFGLVFLMAVGYNIVAAPIFAFTDNATMGMLGGQRALYGRVRLGGTIGFGIMALVAGELAERYGLTATFRAGALLMAVGVLVMQTLRHERAEPAGAKPGRFTDLLADRRWVPFLMLAFAGGLATAVSAGYLFSYMRELGISESIMGLALTLATVAEVPVFFFGNRLLKRMAPFQLLVAAMALSGVRLLLFVFSGATAVVLFLQFLNGVTFPAMWVAGVAYADEHAPPGLGATAQGLFGAFVFGFGSAVGGFAAGPLLENLGGRGMYLVFGVVILAIVVAAALLQRRVAAAARVAAAG